jgi:hypothetical protein
MSDDLDPRLAELLRRAPQAPLTLDDARRRQVLSEARQAWFRAQGRRRLSALAAAAAACLAAGVAGWSLRVVSETPLPTDRAMTDAQSIPVMLPAASPAPAAPAAAAPVPAMAVMDGAVGGAAPAQDGAMAKAFAAEMPAEAERNDALAMPAASQLAEVPMAARQEAKAADGRKRSVERSVRDDRVILASLVLVAEREGRLPSSERLAALRAARALLDGLDQPEAAALRAQLDQLLRTP